MIRLSARSGRVPSNASNRRTISTSRRVMRQTGMITRCYRSLAGRVSEGWRFRHHPPNLPTHVVPPFRVGRRECRRAAPTTHAVPDPPETRRQLCLRPTLPTRSLDVSSIHLSRRRDGGFDVLALPRHHRRRRRRSTPNRAPIFLGRQERVAVPRLLIRPVSRHAVDSIRLSRRARGRARRSDDAPAASVGRRGRRWRHPTKFAGRGASRGLEIGGGARVRESRGCAEEFGRRGGGALAEGLAE